MNLRKPLLVLLVLTMVRCVAAAGLPAGVWEKLPPHPRVFANAQRMEAMRKQIVADPVSRKFYALIRADAEAILTQPPIAYVDTGSFMLGPMSQGRRRITVLAFAYRIEGDARFLTRAKREMQDLVALPNWYDVHFLDTAQALVGVSLGLDWLYAELSPAERTTFAKAIVDKGLKVSWPPDDTPLWWVSGSSHGKGLGWVTNNGNWNQTCHLGVTVGSLVVAENEPVLARKTVERAVANLHFAGDEYAPNGAWPEGPSYGTAGTGSHVELVEALRTTLGTTADLEKFPGFMKFPDALVYESGPTGGSFNFGDAHWVVRPYTPSMFWFARELGRGDLIDTELAEIDRAFAELQSGGKAPRGGDPLALLCWDPSLLNKKTPITRPLWWFSGGEIQPVVTMRSAWGDPMATFIAFKGGTASNSHAHMDVGGFVLDADGVRWAVDLGAESYPQARNNGIKNEELFNQSSQDSKRWWIFRDGPEGHNILRFADALQTVGAVAKVRPAGKGANPMAYVVDLTPVYQGQVQSVRRGFSLLPNHRVLIQDEWTAGSEVARVTAQWVSRAKITKQPDGLLLQQDGKSLRIRLLEPAWIDVEDVSQPKHAYDSANPGLSRIIFRSRSEPGAKGRLVVLAEPQDQAGADPAPAVVPIDQW